MATPTVIGPTTFVRGHVSGSGDIHIAGRVEGDVACTGEVVIDAPGLVSANVSAGRIVVRGAVKGDLVAEDAILIESGGRVVGDLSAPRIAIAPGGRVQGHVQTGEAGPARPRAAATARATETKPRAAAAPPPRAAKSAPASAPAANNKANNHNVPASRVATLPTARVGPPAPVVPVLKKGTKAVQKKQR